MDVGILLRNARERRRLSIEDLSAATKIPVPVLCAMEAGDFRRVPGGIFARGFLRAVAREIGLEPEDVVARYLAELELLHGAAQPGAAAPAGVADAAGTRVSVRRRSAAQIVWLAAAAVAWIVMARALSTGSSAPVLPAPALPVESAAAIEPAGDAPVAFASSSPSSAVSPDDAPVGTTGAGFRIDLQPRGDCWIEATADGVPVVYRLMRDGEREAIAVESELLLRVGDPAAFAFEIDGRAGRALGPPSTPVTVRITPENYGELVAQ